MLKNKSRLTVSVPINLSIKLGFVSVNGPRETYFVDALRMNNQVDWPRPFESLYTLCRNISHG